MPLEYKLSDAFFAGLAKQILLRTGPLLLLALGAGLYVGAPRIDHTLFPIAALFVTAVATFSIAKNIRRQKRSYRSFRIKVSEDRIERTQEGFPPLEIAFTDLTALWERPGKVLVLQGRNRHSQLFIPATLERFDEVRAQLAAHRAIAIRTGRTYAYPMTMAVSLLVLAAMIVVWKARSAQLVLPAGFFLLAILAWSVFATLRSPHIDKKIKRSLWLVSFVAFGIVMAMWVALSR